MNTEKFIEKVLFPVFKEVNKSITRFVYDEERECVFVYYDSGCYDKKGKCLESLKTVNLMRSSDKWMVINDILHGLPQEPVSDELEGFYTIDNEE